MTGVAKGELVLVQQVKIEAVDEQSVAFSTRAMAVNGEADHPRKTFVVARGEVGTAPGVGAPPAVAMVAGAIGNLYLSRVGWQTTTPDGFQIFGAGTAYPRCAAGPRMLAHLSVVPTSVIVRGEWRGERFAIELLGGDAAESQNIQWNGASDIAVRLTARGAERLGAERVVQVWPTQIVVVGSPAHDLSVTGEVDLLDCSRAGFVQHLAYDKRGQAVMLSLTSAGIGAFHVEPQQRAS